MHTPTGFSHSIPVSTPAASFRKPQFGQLSDRTRSLMHADNKDTFVWSSTIDVTEKRIRNNLPKLYQGYLDELATSKEPELRHAQAFGKALAQQFAGLPDIFTSPLIEAAFRDVLITQIEDNSFHVDPQTLPIILQELEKAPGLVSDSLIKFLIDAAQY